MWQPASRLAVNKRDKWVLQLNTFASYFWSNLSSFWLFYFLFFIKFFCSFHFTLPPLNVEPVAAWSLMDSSGSLKDQDWFYRHEENFRCCKIVHFKPNRWTVWGSQGMDWDFFVGLLVIEMFTKFIRLISKFIFGGLLKKSISAGCYQEHKTLLPCCFKPKCQSSCIFSNFTS